MAKTPKGGIVYIMTNPAMPKIVKIGKTKREILDDRMRELHTTGVPVPFVCEYTCRGEDCTEAESALHIAFGPSRANPQREHFSIYPEQAVVILKLLAKENVTPEVERQIDRSVKPIDLDSGRRLRKKRPRINFLDMGIPVGSELKWKHGTESVTVTSEHQVGVADADLYLTKLTSRLLGKDHNIKPGSHWTYNGRLLSNIYDETYPSSEVDKI